MAFDWDNYFKLAKILKKLGTKLNDNDGLKEACCRSSISRAYYYAYHFATAHALLFGFSVTSKSDDHKNLPIFFKELGTPNNIKISRLLQRIKNSRVLADYKPEQKVNIEKQMENTLLDTEDLVKSVNPPKT